MSPVRALREAVASALKPLQIEVHDVLPETINPPAATVSLASVGPSRSQSSLGMVFLLEVTLVGERADFHDAQVRLDDLEWDVWTALQGTPNLWLLSAEPHSVNSGGQDFPAVVYTVEAPSPC